LEENTLLAPGCEQFKADSGLKSDFGPQSGDREVAMSEKADVRIELDAAKALVEWKSAFADEVASRARRLAAESGHPERVTLLHYRQAAQIAVQSLSAAILEGGASSGDQRAA
jgi:hypothetical protein